MGSRMPSADISRCTGFRCATKKLPPSFSNGFTASRGLAARWPPLAGATNDCSGAGTRRTSASRGRGEMKRLLSRTGHAHPVHHDTNSWRLSGQGAGAVKVILKRGALLTLHSWTKRYAAGGLSNFLQESQLRTPGNGLPLILIGGRHRDRWHQIVGIGLFNSPFTPHVGSVSDPEFVRNCHARRRLGHPRSYAPIVVQSARP